MLRALFLGLLTVFATASCSKKSDAPTVAVGAAAGKVVEITGQVSATREGKTRELAMGADVFRDDQIATSADATVTIELFHNGAKWAVVANKQARVDASLAWGLDKQAASKTVEHNSAAAGRNAERSAADTASTTAMKEEAKPAAASESVPSAGAPAPGGQDMPATGGAANERGRAATPPPPPPPPPKPSNKKGAASAPRDVAAPMAPKNMSADKEDIQADKKESDELDGTADPKIAVVISPQTLAERQRPELQKCLDKASKVTLTIDVRKNKTTTTVNGTNVTDKVRTCMDAVVQKIEWPVPGSTVKIVLKF